MKRIMALLLTCLAPLVLAADRAPTDPLRLVMETSIPEIDMNGDGKPDYKRKYDEEGRMVSSENDLNFDGRVDETFERPPLAPGKELTRRDRDFDGRFEETLTELVYRDRVLHSTFERDRNGDGKPDFRVVRAILPEKKLALEVTEQDDDFDGKFAAPKVVSRPIGL